MFDDGGLLMNMNFKVQQGFTLVELMISIALGLIVVAAGLSLFINGLKGSKLQEGVLNIQDSGIFGLEYVADHVRLANYANVENRNLHDQTPFGGIIFSTGLPSSTNVNLAAGNKNNTTPYATNILTQSSDAQGWTSLGNTDRGSDQLTIQFVAPQNMHNCEGESVFRGDRVVQRYFLRVDTNSTAYDQNLPRYGLACDANTPAESAESVQANPGFLTGFSIGNGGEIIIPDVDYFGFVLGARVGNDFRYFTVKEYKDALAAARLTPTPVLPTIEVIKMSILVKSANEISGSEIDPNKTYSILGQDIKLKKPKSANRQNKFARQVYVKTIGIRNALGDRL